MATNDPLEIEVKFLVDSLADVRRRVLDAGARLARERVFEHNLSLDTPDETLRRRECLLRLRQDNDVILTFKGLSEADAGSEAKVREELEVTVSDLETAVAIFERLGYRPQQVYEKYRETFALDDVEIVLDEMPYGNFVELEGPEEAIKAAAARLHLPWEQRLVTNYLALMARIREYYDLPFNDLTFANFEKVDVSLSDVVEQNSDDA